MSSNILLKQISQTSKCSTNMRHWEWRGEDERDGMNMNEKKSWTVGGLQHANKHLHLAPMRDINDISIKQLVQVSFTFEIGSQARRINTHCVIDKQSSPKMPKEKSQMTKRYPIST